MAHPSRPRLGDRRCGEGPATTLMRNSPMSTARKLAAFTKKQAAAPAAASRAPASAGPNTLERLKAEELSAMALIGCSRPARSPRNACRIGISNALISPATRESAYTHWIVMARRRSESERQPSAEETAAAAALAVCSPARPHATVEREQQDRQRAEERDQADLQSRGRSSRANHPSATVCIQVPQSETN